MSSMNEKGPKKRVKQFCPRCGSTDIFFASGLPYIWSIWDCRRCGYRGIVILEDSALAAKMQEDWEKSHNSDNGFH
jgi:ribosomal protein S27AE